MIQLFHLAARSLLGSCQLYLFDELFLEHFGDLFRLLLEYFKWDLLILFLEFLLRRSQYLLFFFQIIFFLEFTEV
jgi:hypothetical protein